MSKVVKVRRLVSVDGKRRRAKAAAVTDRERAFTLLLELASSKNTSRSLRGSLVRKFLLLARAGLSAKQIAARLRVSPARVGMLCIEVLQAG